MRPGTAPCAEAPEDEAMLTQRLRYEEEDSVDLPNDQLTLMDPAASPKNEQAWAKSTKARLGRAKILRQAAECELAKSVVGHHEGKQNHNQVMGKMQSHLRKKIDTTHNLARSLWDRTTGTEDTIRHIGHSIFQLTRAQQATLAPLDVIGRCLELRKARPASELVHDTFQKSLEEEQAMLFYSQRQYSERMGMSRSVLEELKQAKEMLHADMVKKRHATRLDKAVMRGTDGGQVKEVPGDSHQQEEEGHLPPMPDATNAARPVSAEGPIRPQTTSGGSPQKAVLSARTHAEYMQRKGNQEVACVEPAMPQCQQAKWHDNTQALITNTYDQCGMATRLCTKNEEMLRDRQRDCESARKIVVESMRRRLTETGDLKKALELELRETNFALQCMEEGLAESERQCELHNVPLAQVKHGMALRNKRLDGEKVRDTVQVAKEHMLNVINANLNAFQEQYRRKKAVLDQMSAVRQQLSDDLTCKVKALYLDNQCSKLLTRPHSARMPVAPAHPMKPHFRRKGQQNNSNQPREDPRFAQTWGPGSNDW